MKLNKKLVAAIKVGNMIIPSGTELIATSENVAYFKGIKIDLTQIPIEALESLEISLESKKQEMPIKPIERVRIGDTCLDYNDDSYIVKGIAMNAKNAMSSWPDHDSDIESYVTHGEIEDSEPLVLVTGSDGEEYVFAYGGHGAVVYEKSKSANESVEIANESSKPITTTQPMHLANGVLMPEGVKLVFDNQGVAKYKGKYEVHRMKVPMAYISGAKGPFATVRQAKVLNDNWNFQQSIGKHFPSYCHCILWGENLIVFIWDTRIIVDVMNLEKWGKPQPITRKLKAKDSDKVIEQTVAWTKPWLSKLYAMMEWDSYNAMDNGLPLVTDNKDWQAIVKDLNAKAIQ